MFPLRDDNPTLLTPVVTIVLILANVGVWLYVQGMGYDEGAMVSSICTFGAIPAEITGRVAADAALEAADRLVCEPGGLSYATVLTSMFLHGSWLHLIANMWFLWLFGNNVEDAMGHVRFLLFYTLTGIAAAAAQIYATPASPVPMVGASGAISGVMGGYLLLYPRIRIQTLFIFIIILRIIPVPAWFVLALWFALQLLSGYTDPMGTAGVAVWAHVGGFVAGVGLVKIFEDRRLTAERRRRRRLAT